MGHHALGHTGRRDEVAMGPRMGHGCAALRSPVFSPILHSLFSYVPVHESIIAKSPLMPARNSPGRHLSGVVYGEAVAG